MSCFNESRNSFTGNQWFDYVKLILESGNTFNQRQIMYTGSNGRDLYVFSNACIAVRNDGVEENCYIDSATDYIQLYPGDIVYYDDRNKLKRLTPYRYGVEKQQHLLQELSRYNRFCKEFAHKNHFVKLIDTLGIKLSEHDETANLRNCVQLMFNEQPVLEKDWFKTLVAVTLNNNLN